MQKPKRILVVGCSHGEHIDTESAQAVLKFQQDYKPHTTLHLGDFIDAGAFMASKVRDGDGSAILPDLTEGMNFLSELRPTIMFCGNHEDRLWNLREDTKNELVRFAAGHVIEKIEYLARQVKAELVPYDGTYDPNSWREYGGTAFGHGFMYGEMCARDHAELVGQPVCHAHAHKLMRQPGRVIGAPGGICCASLASIPAMRYAKNRRQTAAWDNGYVWGEYTDKWCKLYLERIKIWQRPKIPRGK